MASSLWLCPGRWTCMREFSDILRIFWCKEINIYEVTVVRSSPEYQTTSFRFRETSSRHSYANRWCVFEMNPENKIKVNSSREDLWNLAETRNEEMKCKKSKKYSCHWAPNVRISFHAQQSVSSSFRLFILYHSKDLFSSFLFSFFFIHDEKKLKKISGNFILCFVGQASLVLVEKNLFMAEKLKL